MVLNLVSLPIPTWETVKQYRQAARTTNSISRENLDLMLQEMKQRGCKGIGGIHWGEMAIKEGVVLCKRPGESVGFEEIHFGADLNMRPEDLDNDTEEEKIKGDSSSESTDSDSAASDHDDSSSETEELSNETLPSKKAKLICQFFFSSLEGDFSWPVASFPLHKINHRVLSSIFGKCVRPLVTLTLATERK